MLQCTERSESRKDNVGGGTTTYYEYDRRWESRVWGRSYPVGEENRGYINRKTQRIP